MLQKEDVFKILKKAAITDRYFGLFGSDTHRYRLKPAISSRSVRDIEDAYGFTLPEDYFVLSPK